MIAEHVSYLSNNFNHCSPHACDFLQVNYENGIFGTIANMKILISGGNSLARTEISDHAMLCYAMLRYAMLCYAMLCYAMLCYAMLCPTGFLPSAGIHGIIVYYDTIMVPAGQCRPCCTTAVVSSSCKV